MSAAWPEMDGCGDFDDFDAKLERHTREGFLLVEEGGCTYEEKARRAERLGFQALIIGEDLTASIDSRSFHNSDSMYDGSGLSVAIPTMIIGEDDA